MKAIFALAICLSLLAPGRAAAAEKSTALPPRKAVLDCLARDVALSGDFAVESVESVPLPELAIPFLGGKIETQTGIRVRYKPATIQWKEPRGGALAQDSYERHVTVYLDAKATRVLAVKSRLAERSPDILDEPPAKDEEARLRQKGALDESFPADAPKVSFMAALEVVRARSVGSPRGAQEIDGFCVMYRTAERQPHPVWIINLRGLPPLRAMSRPFGGVDTRPASMRNFTQSLVDATTGEWIATSNNPKPRNR